MLTINGKPLPTGDYTPEVYDAWRKFGEILARQADQPLARFLAEHCRGLSREDKQDALAAFLAHPGWDEPAEWQVTEAMRSLDGVAFLVSRLADPPITGNEAKEQWVSEDNRLEVLAQVQRMADPSDEDILAANQALRERIARAAAPA